MHDRLHGLLESLAAERLRRMDEERALILEEFPNLSAEGVARRAVAQFATRDTNGTGTATARQQAEAHAMKRTRKYAQGEHWMQRPENRAKVLALIKRSHRTRRRNKKARAETPTT